MRGHAFLAELIDGGVDGASEVNCVLKRVVSQVVPLKVAPGPLMSFSSWAYGVSHSTALQGRLASAALLAQARSGALRPATAPLSGSCTTSARSGRAAPRRLRKGASRFPLAGRWLPSNTQGRGQPWLRRPAPHNQVNIAEDARRRRGHDSVHAFAFAPQAAIARLRRFLRSPACEPARGGASRQPAHRRKHGSK